MSLKFCKGLNPAPNSEMLAKQKYYPQKPAGEARRCLVLDLDETLIHCVTTAG